MDADDVRGSHQGIQGDIRGPQILLLPCGAPDQVIILDLCAENVYFFRDQARDISETDKAHGFSAERAGLFQNFGN